jgi:hypothetical protein
MVSVLKNEIYVQLDSAPALTKLCSTQPRFNVTDLYCRWLKTKRLPDSSQVLGYR